MRFRATLVLQSTPKGSQVGLEDFPPCVVGAAHFFELALGNPKALCQFAAAAIGTAQVVLQQLNLAVEGLDRASKLFRRAGCKFCGRGKLCNLFNEALLPLEPVVSDAQLLRTSSGLVVDTVEAIDLFSALPGDGLCFLQLEFQRVALLAEGCEASVLWSGCTLQLRLKL
jgi:hypothetical protein